MTKTVETQAYQESFTIMLSKLQSMWDGRVGYIDYVKRQTKLLGPDKATKHFAQYPIGTNTQLFERTEMEKMLFENVTERGQTEWKAHVVFGPKKNKALRFCVEYRNLTTSSNASRNRSVV